MLSKSLPALRGFVAALPFALVACGGNDAQTNAANSASTAAPASTPAAAPAEPAAQGVVRVDGSSTVYPITEAVAEEFQAQSQTRTQVTVGVSGTGGGFKKFCRGELDVANASRPIQQAEMDECAKAGVKFFELPVAFDALTVVVNPSNAMSSISIEQLRKIWEPAAQGTVMRWNQVDATWPDAELKLYGAGADSGTFDYFTEAVVGKAKSSRGDFTASEDDNVLVQGVAQDIGGLGYFGLAYYIENQGKLKALAIVPPGGGDAVMPSKETVMSGAYTPLSRPLLVYVSQASYARPEVKAFVDFYIANAAALSEDAKYVPLPANAYTTIAANLAAGKLGTVFGGTSATGVTIEDLLAREAKH